MRFQDIPGQKQTITQFKTMMANDQLPHAILLLGPRGNAKLATAIALANYIQCTDRGDDSCGQCRSCQKSHKYVHPDIHFSFPVVKKEGQKREDTTSQHFMPAFREFISEQPFDEIQSWIKKITNTTSIANINTKECNEIVKKLGMQSFEGDYKIQIIWMAEYLAKDSNRLLKLIEEPTDKTILILIAEKQEQILATILSRCQIFTLSKVNDEEMERYLDQLNLPASLNRKEIIQLANGDIDKANSLAFKQQSDRSSLLLNWMRIAWRSHPDDVFPFVNDLARSTKDEQIAFLEYGIHFFREFLVYVYTKDLHALRLSEAEKNTALKMIKTIDEEKAQKISEMLTESIHLINRNISGKILFSAKSFQLSRIMKGIEEKESITYK